MGSTEFMRQSFHHKLSYKISEYMSPCCARALRHYSAFSRAVFMVATQTLESELAAHGFTNVVSWTRGVDTEFHLDLPKPVSVYVGRVSVEKNIEEFLNLDMRLRQKYPEVVFTGPKFGEDLAAHYTSGDVFVFPSLTDTFGMLEAMASGLPVAAFPVTGPLDVIGDTKFMDENLSKAVEQALQVTDKQARKHAEKYSSAQTSFCKTLFVQAGRSPNIHG